VGFDDPRGQLFLEICRFLVQRRPRAFLLENVVNLLYIDGGDPKRYVSLLSVRSHSVRCPRLTLQLYNRGLLGRAFQTIVAHLEGAGYVVKWRVISSGAWVPQQRERLYFVGFRVGGASNGGSSSGSDSNNNGSDGERGKSEEEEGRCQAAHGDGKDEACTVAGTEGGSNGRSALDSPGSSAALRAWNRFRWPEGAVSTDVTGDGGGGIGPGSGRLSLYLYLSIPLLSSSSPLFAL
jgi:site-specific DNA-cytosine methylase